MASSPGFEACGGGNADRAIKRRLQGENNRQAGFIPRRSDWAASQKATAGIH
jgi:hypothetical protein